MLQLASKSDKYGSRYGVVIIFMHSYLCKDSGYAKLCAGFSQNHARSARLPSIVRLARIVVCGNV